MGVRLLKQHEGQAANTVYWASGAVEQQLIASGTADTQVELASDYEQQGRFITSATAQTLTLGQSGYWPIGKVITVSQMGTGAVTVAPASGVTVNTKLTSLVTGGQYSIGQLKKVATNTWLAFGGFGG